MASRWGGTVGVGTYADAPNSPDPMEATGRRYITFYFTGAATVSSGAITIETAPTRDYAGTWAPIGSAFTVSTVTGSKVLFVQIPVGAYTYIRLRESTTIVPAGSVAARCEAN